MASLNKTPLLSTTPGKGAPKSHRTAQYFATFSASLVTFSVGMILGYLSPASYQIRHASGSNSGSGMDILEGMPSRILAGISTPFPGGMYTPTPVVISTPTPAGISTPTPPGISTPNTPGIFTPAPLRISTPTPEGISTPTSERITTPTIARISTNLPQEKQSSKIDLGDARAPDDRLWRSQRSVFGARDEDSTETTSFSEENLHRPSDEGTPTLLEVATVALRNESQEINGTENEQISMTVGELAWFSSSSTLGAIAGLLLGSLLQNYLGRRGSILVAVLPGISGWFLIGLGRDVGPLIVGRALTGLFLGIAMWTALIYVAEISSPEIRGFLTLFVDLSLSLGKLFVVVLGSLTHWQDLALAATAPMFLLFVCMIFCKETPSHLINKEKYDAARSALQHFRGRGVDVSLEFESLKTYQIEEAKNRLRCSQVMQPKVYRPLGIGLGIGIFVQLSGIDMLSFNLASIFEQSGSTLSDNGCSIVATCFQVIGNAVGIICIETTGRKKLLLASSFGMTISYVCLGSYFYTLQVDQSWAQTYIFWMPLVAVIFYMLSFSIGFGPVPLVLVGETFPPSVRETAASLVGVVTFATAFVVVVSYDAMQEALTLGGFYWLFAIFCILAGTFTALFVKETKGKTLAEVSAMFGGGSPSYIALEPTHGNPPADNSPVGTQNVGDLKDVQKDSGVNGTVS